MYLCTWHVHVATHCHMCARLKSDRTVKNAALTKVIVKIKRFSVKMFVMFELFLFWFNSKRWNYFASLETGTNKCFSTVFKMWCKSNPSCFCHTLTANMCDFMFTSGFNLRFVFIFSPMSENTCVFVCASSPSAAQCLILGVCVVWGGRAEQWGYPFHPQPQCGSVVEEIPATNSNS